MSYDQIDLRVPCNCWKVRFDPFQQTTQLEQGYRFHTISSRSVDFIAMRGGDRLIRLKVTTAQINNVGVMLNDGRVSAQERVVRAEYDRHKRHFIAPSKYTEDTYFWVSSDPGISLHALQKVEVPKPIIKKSRLWVGADGLELQEMCGEWNDPNKRQLFRIQKGESIYLSDGKRQIWVVTAKGFGKPPKFRLATRREISEWAYREGYLRGGNSRDAREWARGVIAETGVTDVMARYNTLYPRP